MNENTKRSVIQALEEAEHQCKVELLNDLESHFFNEAETYSKVLDSDEAWRILTHSFGGNYQALAAKRGILIERRRLLYQVCGYLCRQKYTK